MQSQKTILACLFLCIALAGCGRKDSESVKYPSVVPPQNWKRFSSEEGKFSVRFPGAPEETKQIQKSPIGEVEERIFSVNVDIQTVYAVAYCDSSKFTEAAITKNAQDFLRKSQSITVAKQMGQTVFQQEMKISNFPAREYEYVAGGKANFSVRVRLILVGSRVYQILAIFLTANPHPVARAIFFNSFQLQN
jgi:hypothetical protein